MKNPVDPSLPQYYTFRGYSFARIPFSGESRYDSSDALCRACAGAAASRGRSDKDGTAAETRPLGFPHGRIRLEIDKSIPVNRTLEMHRQPFRAQRRLDRHRRGCGDFVLEGEFLYNGKSEGGVLVRGDKEAWIPWLHGYKMDIDADMPGTGHIHFPFRPQPNPGVVQFPVNVWQHFSIRAAGQVISVKLDGKEVIKFRDDHYRYGSICLEGEKGGLRYRNLRVQRQDITTPAGPRSPYTELFDSAAPPGMKTEGAVLFANGVVEIDGSARPASVRFPQAVVAGAVELDVWCKRRQGSMAPYRIGFLAGGSRFRPLLYVQEQPRPAVRDRAMHVPVSHVHGDHLRGNVAV